MQPLPLSDGRLSQVQGSFDEVPHKVPSPAILTAPQRLHFEELGFDQFESLVLSLLNLRDGVKHAQKYGSRGHAQQGIDLFGVLNSAQSADRGYITVQCRNVKALEPAEMKELVDKFLAGEWASRSSTFVLASRSIMTSPKIVEAQEEARGRLQARGIDFEVWDGEQLGEQLRARPELVERFFGLPTAELFCDRAARRPAPAQLPPPPSTFTGRALELAELDRARAQGSSRRTVVLAISGMAGVGKSALAVHFGYELLDNCVDGQLYADLRGAEAATAVDPLDVLGQFLRDLGVPPNEIPQSVTERAASYRSLLAGRRMLIILDNARDEAHVRPLLPGSSGCVTIITSRRALGTLEAVQKHVSLDPLPDDDGALLLGRLIGEDRVGLEPERAAELLRLCGGVPLALRIVGARLRNHPHRPLSDMCRRLRDEHGRVRQLEHHDLSVRASFMASYRELYTDHARLFRRLSLIPGMEIYSDLASAIVDQVLIGPGSSLAPHVLFGDLAPITVAETAEVNAIRQRIEAGLDVLADAQLLEPSVGGGYRWHDLIRVFAHNLLLEEEGHLVEHDMLRAVVMWAIVGVAAAADWIVGPERWIPGPETGKFGDSRQALDWLEEQRTNLVAAVGIAHDLQYDKGACGLASLLGHFFLRQNYWADWHTANELALASARRNGDKNVEAHTLFEMYTCLDSAGRHAEAASYLEQCHALINDDGDLLMRVKVSAALAISFVDGRLPNDADLLLSSAEDLLDTISGQDYYSRAAVEYARASLLEARATIAKNKADADEALRCYESAAGTWLHLNNGAEVISCLTEIGNIRRQQGELDQAMRAAHEALSLCESTDVGAHIEADAFLLAGEVHGQQGEEERGLDLLEEALRRFTALGRQDKEIHVRVVMCILLRSLGKMTEARKCWAAATAGIETADQAVADLWRTVIAENKTALDMLWNSDGMSDRPRPAPNRRKRKRR